MTLKREKPSKHYIYYGMCYSDYILRSLKKNLFPFCNNILDIYLKQKTHNEKTSKPTCILKTYLNLLLQFEI